jgi:hypothetical protein
LRSRHDVSPPDPEAVFANVRSRRLKAWRATKKLATTSAPEYGTANKGHLLHHGVADAWALGRASPVHATVLRQKSGLSRY